MKTVQTIEEFKEITGTGKTLAVFQRTGVLTVCLSNHFFRSWSRNSTSLHLFMWTGIS